MKPDLMIPDLMIPDVMVPEVMKPDVIIPDSIVPGVMVPEVMKPDLMIPDSMVPDVMKPDVTQPNLMQTVDPIEAADSSDLKPQLLELINETMLNLVSKLLNLVNDIKPAGQIRTDHLMEPAKPIEPTVSERLTGFKEHVNQTALDLQSRILRIVNETASVDLMKPNESMDSIDQNGPENSLKS